MDFGKSAAERKADKGALLGSLGLHCPEVRWNRSYLNYSRSGNILPNLFFACQEAYVIGMGRIETSNAESPDKHCSLSLINFSFLEGS
jgi:hypothetical protein